MLSSDRRPAHRHRGYGKPLLYLEQWLLEDTTRPGSLTGSLKIFNSLRSSRRLAYTKYPATLMLGRLSKWPRHLLLLSNMHYPNQSEGCTPVHMTFQEADRATRQRLSQLRDAALTVNRGDTLNPLVLGAVMPTSELCELLTVPASPTAMAAVIFLPDELGHCTQSLASQRYGISTCWDISKQMLTAYHTWDFPDLKLAAPQFEAGCKSQLWIPLHGMDCAFGAIMKHDQPQQLHTVFVSSTGVSIGEHVITHDDLVELQLASASARSSSQKNTRYFSPEQLQRAEQTARQVGKWPWLGGVWPVQFEQHEDSPVDSINVIGGFLFDISVLRRLTTDA